MLDFFEAGRRFLARVQLPQPRIDLRKNVPCELFSTDVPDGVLGSFVLFSRWA